MTPPGTVLLVPTGRFQYYYSDPGFRTLHQLREGSSFLVLDSFTPAEEHTGLRLARILLSDGAVGYLPEGDLSRFEKISQNLF